MAQKPKPEQLDFDQALSRLEQIVGRLESGEASLEESITLFEEATRLCTLCEETLRKAEGRIQQLVDRGAGGTAVEEMEPE